MTQPMETKDNTAEENIDVYKRNTCRLCGSQNLGLVMPMPASPVADGFVPAERREESQKYYALDLYQCQNCGLVHLRDVVNPEVIYRNYLYETTTSPGLVAHFQKYAADILERLDPSRGSLVVEIGSNDGTLLKFFKQAGMRVLGIDPARDIARRATQAGIETWGEFFSADVSVKIKEQKGAADIVIANNVVANIDHLDRLIEGIRNVLSPNGVFIFETGYLVDSVQNLVFDNVYHEHISYFSVKPLQVFFKKHGMELIRVDRVPTKGGSIRGTVQLKGGIRHIEFSVDDLVNMEIERGFYKPDMYKEFTRNIDREKKKLLELLKELKAQGKTIAGYGASHSVTTFLHYFGIAQYLDFIVDDNPRKHNTLSPGHHIPVFPSEEIYTRKADYIVILAWRFYEQIIQKHAAYLKDIGAFIIPMPVLKVVKKEG
jgi:SAM-dependent methyltransferase